MTSRSCHRRRVRITLISVSTMITCQVRNFIDQYFQKLDNRKETHRVDLLTLGSPFKCPVVSGMLHGPSMDRIGNTAYIDLDMSELNGPVAAEVTGKLFFYMTEFSDLIYTHTHTRARARAHTQRYNIYFACPSPVFQCRSGRNNYSVYIDEIIIHFISRGSSNATSRNV